MNTLTSLRNNLKKLKSLHLKLNRIFTDSEKNIVHADLRHKVGLLFYSLEIVGATEDDLFVKLNEIIPHIEAIIKSSLQVICRIQDVHFVLIHRNDLLMRSILLDNGLGTYLYNGNHSKKTMHNLSGELIDEDNTSEFKQKCLNALLQLDETGLIEEFGDSFLEKKPDGREYYPKLEAIVVDLKKCGISRSAFFEYRKKPSENFGWMKPNNDGHSFQVHKSTMKKWVERHGGHWKLKEK